MVRGCGQDMIDTIPQYLGITQDRVLPRMWYQFRVVPALSESTVERCKRDGEQATPWSRTLAKQRQCRIRYSQQVDCVCLFSQKKLCYG